MLADPVAKLENWESIKEEMASSNVIQRLEACCEKVPRSPLESLGWFKQIHDKANQLGIRLRMAFKKLYQTCLRFCFGWKYHFTSPKQKHHVEKTTQRLSMGVAFQNFSGFCQPGYPFISMNPEWFWIGTLAQTQFTMTCLLALCTRNKGHTK